MRAIKTADRFLTSICLAYRIFTFREFKPIHKGKTAILHLCFGTEKNRRLGSKKARSIRAFRRRRLLSPHYGPSVEIRTQGLLNPIQARYQTSPHPEMSRLSGVPLSDFDIIPHHIPKCKSFLQKTFHFLRSYRRKRYCRPFHVFCSDVKTHCHSGTASRSGRKQSPAPSASTFVI